MFKVLYINYLESYNLSNDIIYNFLTSNNIKFEINYLMNKLNNWELFNNKNLSNEEIIEDSNLIICNEINDISLINILLKYKNKVILHITKSIEIYNPNLKELYEECMLKYGNYGIKFPLFMQELYNIGDEINNNVTNITFDNFINKRFAILMSNHDKGNTKIPIYDKLKDLGGIVCPFNLLNNFNYINNLEKEFIFNICPESYDITNKSNKLYRNSLSGSIPIYYGKLDNIDKLIYNTNRIILCDPNSEISLEQTHKYVKDLLLNPQKLYEYYKQPIYNNNYKSVIDDLLIEFLIKLKNVVENIKYFNETVYTQNKIIGNIVKNINYENDIINNNYIFCLSTNMKMLTDNNFHILLYKLLEQKPKNIIIKLNLCEDIEPYIIYNNDHPSLIIHCYNSINPHMNIDNLILLSEKLNILDTDRIIFINDTFNPCNNLISLYDLCYQLYNSDGIVINNDNNMCIFSNNYEGYIYENMSYSFKYEFIKDINISELDQIATIYNKNLDISCIHLKLGGNILQNNIIFPNIFNRKNKKIKNIQIENEILETINLSNNYLININDYDRKNKNINIKYYNNNTILITIIYYNDIPINDTINLNINKINYNFEIINTNSSKKSYLLSLYNN